MCMLTLKYILIPTKKVKCLPQIPQVYQQKLFKQYLNFTSTTIHTLGVSSFSYDSIIF